jgi:hypothetical protein
MADNTAERASLGQLSLTNVSSSICSGVNLGSFKIAIAICLNNQMKDLKYLTRKIRNQNEIKLQRDHN